MKKSSKSITKYLEQTYNCNWIYISILKIWKSNNGKYAVKFNNEFQIFSTWYSVKTFINTVES